MEFQILSLGNFIIQKHIIVTICVASKIVVESGNKKKIEAKNAGLRKANCDLFYDKFHRFRGKLVVIHFRKHKGGHRQA